MVKIKKTTVSEILRIMEQKDNSVLCPLKSSKDLKCDFFKKFLALEYQKNELRKKNHQK